MDVDQKEKLTALEREIKNRFGVLPNFFRLTPDNPEITANLWGFAKFAYLDNPLPSLFKERLFVYLSRFCEVRYCIARHAAFLNGLGRPSGDGESQIQSVAEIIRLIQEPLPRGKKLAEHLDVLRNRTEPLFQIPDPDTDLESSIFVCSSHVFLQTSDAEESLKALQGAMGVMRIQYLNLFLSFVRTAHYWTKLHPELKFEDDVNILLDTHHALATCILNDPEANASKISEKLLDELLELREKTENFKELSAEHEQLLTAYHAQKNKEKEQDLKIKAQKEELSISEQKFRYLSESGLINIAFYNSTGTITHANDAFLTMMGYTHEELEKGILNWEVLEPNGKKGVGDTPTPNIAPYPSEFTRKDGTKLWGLCGNTKIHGTDQSVRYVIDITELKNTESALNQVIQQLKKSNELLEQYAFVASHDLQEPLRKIQTYSDILLRKSGPDDEKLYVTKISDSAKRMSSLINGLLEYSRLSKVESLKTKVDLNNTVNKIIEDFELIILEKKARINVTTLPFVEGSELQMSQLFYNVISNALKFSTPEKAPIIDIRCTTIDGKLASKVITNPLEESYYDITVSDNGIGFESRFNESIFDIFKRLNTKTIYPGSGIGLSLCKRIVENHNGNIYAESKVGIGTTFHIILPGGK